MPFYLRPMGQGQLPQLWDVREECARLVGVTNAEGGPGTYFERDAYHDIWASIHARTGWFEGQPPEAVFHRLEVPPGHHHPRLARPLWGSVAHMSSPGAVSDPAAAMARDQVHALTRMLNAICLTVHAVDANMAVYGHDIRNLLILACTEVESQWRGSLAANGSSHNRPTTRHYVALSHIMRLAEYEVALVRQPWLAPVCPFRGWNAAEPTNSLAWYAAYNAVKHDRERSFSSATLRNAIDAVAACTILLVAQFASAGGRIPSSTFRFTRSPTWTYGESYVDLPNMESGWTPIPHPVLARGSTGV